MRSPLAIEVQELERPRTIWHKLREWALMGGLAFFGFAVCSSVAGVNIGKAWLLLVALLYAPSIWRIAPWKNPVMAMGLVLLAFITAHTLWHDGWSVLTRQTVNRYQELLMAPILLALMAVSPNRRLFYRAMIVGAVALAITHWFAKFDPRYADLLGSRRISAGFVLSACSFLLLAQSRGHAWAWALRALAVALAVTVLFAVGSRTGYVMVVVLAGVAAWLFAPPRWRWIAALSVPAVVLVLALTSKNVQVRVQETLAGATTQISETSIESTSTAIRIHMLRIAGDMAREHALLGVGYGGYPPAHHAAVMARKAKDPEFYSKVPEIWMRSTNPHNEYLMQLLGGGVLGLVLFVSWLAVTFRAAARLERPQNAMLAGLCLAFAVACMFNSLLLDFVEGHFYMAVLVWLLANKEPRYNGSA